MSGHGCASRPTASGRLRRAGWLLAVFCCLVPLASGQEGDEEPSSTRRADRRKALLEGTHVLRRILFDNGLRPLEEYDALADEPRRTLLVVLGELNVLSQVPGGTEKFVRDGGALLAASDRAISDRQAWKELVDVAGVSISGDQVRCLNRWMNYKELDYCPLVLPEAGAFPPLFRNESAGVLDAQLRVASNIPSYLLRRREFPGTVRPLAYLPPEAVIDSRAGGGVRHRGHLLFAVGGEVGEGRVLVVADHSLFINEMMLPTDTDNVEFSYNAVRWLKGQGGTRDRVLFVEEGRIETRFDIPMKSVSLPADEALRMLFARRNELLGEGERVLARMEDDGLFDRITLDALERVGLPPSRLLHLLMTLGTMAALVVVLHRLGVTTRFRHDTTVLPLPQTLVRAVPDAPLADQRQRALLARGDLREPAAALVRHWFAGLGLDAAAAAPPAFTTTGGPWRRWRLRGRLRALWQLAAGRGRGRISAAALGRLQRELERLRADWQQGAWRATRT